MDAPLGWSPDGTKIAFLSSAGQSKVAILTLADRSIVKHSAVCPSCNGSAHFRSWSPDGTKILIKCENQDGRGTNLCDGPRRWQSDRVVNSGFTGSRS